MTFKKNFNIRQGDLSDNNMDYFRFLKKYETPLNFALKLSGGRTPLYFTHYMYVYIHISIYTHTYVYRYILKTRTIQEYIRNTLVNLFQSVYGLTFICMKICASTEKHLCMKMTPHHRLHTLFI